jgi:hypothetical protein
MSKLWRQCVETDNHNQDPLTCLTGVSYLELGHGGIWKWISLRCPTYFISLLFSAVKHSVADYVRSLLSCNNRLFECNQRLKFCSHYIAGPWTRGKPHPVRVILSALSASCQDFSFFLIHAWILTVSSAGPLENLKYVGAKTRSEETIPCLTDTGVWGIFPI